MDSALSGNTADLCLPARVRANSGEASVAAEHFPRARDLCLWRSQGVHSEEPSVVGVISQLHAI